MIGSRLRKIFRDVWARKSRALMASAAIFVGVLGVVTLLSAGDLLTSQLKQDISEEDLAMQAVLVSAPGGAELDNEAYLRALEETPGVTRVEGRAVQPLAWKLPGEAEFEDGFVLAAWEPFDEIAIQPMRLTGEGRYPTAGQQEIAVEMRMADRYGLDVGSEIMLRSAAGAPEGDPWTITGLVFMPYASFSSTGMPVPNDASLFANFEDAQTLGGFTGYQLESLLYPAALESLGAAPGAAQLAHSVAITWLLPLLVIPALTIFLIPETAGRELEEISPERGGTTS